MHVEVYQRAVDRIHALQKELRSLQSFVSMYDALAAEDGEPDARARSMPRSAGRRVGSDITEIERVVVEVIEENGAPLQRAELFERAKAKGVVIVGTKELVNFSSKLSRLGSLINLPRFGYWPKSKPFGPAGYLQELDDQGSSPAAG